MYTAYRKYPLLIEKKGARPTPVYEMIFRRLKDRLFSWRYRFPELGLVDFGSDKPDGARSLQVEQMKTELRTIHQDAIEEAKQEPIPNDRARV